MAQQYDDSTQLPSLPAGRLTPEAVAGSRFHRVRFGGLAEEEVGRFMDLVQVELAHLLDERADLQEEVEKLLRDQHTPGRGFPAVEAVEVQGVRILERAQLTAEQVVKDAQAAARGVAQDAAQRRDQIMAAARAKAEALTRATLEEATRDALEVRSQAPITAQARVAELEALGGVLESHLRGIVGIVSTALEDMAGRLAARPGDGLNGGRHGQAVA